MKPPILTDLGKGVLIFLVCAVGMFVLAYALVKGGIP